MFNLFPHWFLLFTFNWSPRLRSTSFFFTKHTFSHAFTFKIGIGKEKEWRGCQWCKLCKCHTNRYLNQALLQLQRRLQASKCEANYRFSSNYHGIPNSQLPLEMENSMCLLQLDQQTVLYVGFKWHSGIFHSMRRLRTELHLNYSFVHSQRRLHDIKMKNNNIEHTLNLKRRTCQFMEFKIENDENRFRIVHDKIVEHPTWLKYR